LGGNTPDELVIIATTNRPEKLDPALIRPGRLRLMEFKNLRSCDVVNMLLETYPEEKEEIEKHLERISYEDYQMSGALLEAIMSSCNNINDIFEVIQRELY
jgi:ATP-dependent 26S proteasome regulatory subunit